MVAETDATAAAPMRKQALYGVAGWLYLLVVTMAALGPLFAMSRLHAGLTLAEAHLPSIVSTAEWQATRFASWCAFAAFEAVGVGGGLALAMGTTWTAVRCAMAALWLAGPVEAVVLYMLIPGIVSGSTEFAGAYFLSGFVAPAIASVAWAVGWSVYLVRARRVRATYGKPWDKST